MTTHNIRKVLITGAGDASNVSVVTAPIPPPSKGEVQCDVMYSGFNGADINMRMGTYPMQKTAPLTTGYCFVGRVSALPDNNNNNNNNSNNNSNASSKFRRGDLVGALTVYDAEAQKINVAEKYLVRVSERVDPRQACALFLDWCTAYGLIHHASKGLVAKGRRVFVHCLSGAVGYALATLCAREGAEVYGTASERNHEALRERIPGVVPFTYRDKAWMDEMRRRGGAHVVFDPLGFESWDESWEVLDRREPSRLVGFGGSLNALDEGRRGKPRSQMAATVKLLAKNGCMTTRRSTAFYYIDRDRATYMEDLHALMQMLEDGAIEVPIKAVWDLENIREPHENWGKHPGMGSCLIRVDTSV